MSSIAKRSVVVMGHKTSISLEPEFWRHLRRIAGARDASIGRVVAEIDEARGAGKNLSSAIRLFVLADVEARAGGGPPVAGPARAMPVFVERP